MAIVVLEPKNLNLTQWLSPRPRNSNKWDFGHALVVGGDLGMGGAARLAGEAALRIGAGMVTVMTRPQHVAALLAGCPELMVHGVAQPQAWETALLAVMARATVLMVGSGLGRGPWGQAAFKALLLQANQQTRVVDADGLNLLSSLPSHCERWILTPHVREASRLLNQSVADIQKDPVTAIQALQKKYGGVIVLKSDKTLIADDKNQLYRCEIGNPGMATAGMGDVLSGIIGGLLAQQIPLLEAATLGVYLHALAGDQAAMAGERGMKAGDLMPNIREVANWNTRQPDIMT